MIIKSAEFVESYTDYLKCPEPNRPEYAFIGRSNVGKSSLINLICDKKGLAMVSNTPGKTKAINYFDINNSWYLVDLPGYGFAKMPKTYREKWGEMICDYLEFRPNLQCAFLLIDSCIPPQEIDLDFANFMGEHGVPFVLAFTKTDRKKAQKNKGFLETFEKSMLENWEQMPTYFLTSAEERLGREDILHFIEETNKQYLANK